MRLVQLQRQGLLYHHVNAVQSLDRRPTAFAEHSHAKVALEKRKQSCYTVLPKSLISLQEKKMATHKVCYL